MRANFMFLHAEKRGIRKPCKMTSHDLQAVHKMKFKAACKFAKRTNVQKGVFQHAECLFCRNFNRQIAKK